MSTIQDQDSVSEPCPRNKSVGMLVYRAAVLLFMGMIGWYLHGIKVEVQRLNTAVSAPFGLPVKVDTPVRIQPIFDLPVRIQNQPVSVKVVKE